MSVLSLNRVQFSYPGSAPALRGITAHFEASTFTAITGPSGTGKSTLLSLMAGLDRPTSGTIQVQGKEVHDLSAHRRHNISLVFQAFNLIDYLTPLENLRLVNPKATYGDLERLGISRAQANRSVLHLSGGQQQRVAIGRALVSHAPIILADEPTGALDEDTAAEIVSLLREAAHTHGKTVIAVTHSRALAERADFCYSVSKGKLVKA